MIFLANFEPNSRFLTAYEHFRAFLAFCSQKSRILTVAVRILDSFDVILNRVMEPQFKMSFYENMLRDDAQMLSNMLRLSVDALSGLKWQ